MPELWFTYTINTGRIQQLTFIQQEDPDTINCDAVVLKNKHFSLFTMLPLVLSAVHAVSTMIITKCIDLFYLGGLILNKQDLGASTHNHVLLQSYLLMTGTMP